MAGWCTVRRGWPLLAALALGACLDSGAMGQFGLRGGGNAAQTDKAGAPWAGKVLRKKPMANGDVIVVAPRGYCIDGRATKPSAGGGFAVIAACEVLTEGDVGPAVEPVVMTVTVMPKRVGQTPPTAEQLAAALAPSQVLEREDGDGLVMVYLANGGDVLSPVADPRHWRAAMEINGHLVTLAAYGPKGSTAAGPSGVQLVADLAEALRSASPQQ